MPAQRRPAPLDYGCDADYGCNAIGTRSGRRGVAERGDNVIDHFLDHDTVVALAHHPDHRLGAGRADQQPAMAVEPFFAGVNRGFDLGVVERLAAAIAHILQDLRQRVEAMTDLRHRAAKFLHHREHLKGCDKTVAGGGVVRQNDVTGGFAAEIVAAAQHLFEYIAVADRRAHEFDALAFEEAFQSEIRHHGCYDTWLGEATVFLPALRDHREQLVAIDQVSAFIDENDAVGVAIERDANVGAHFANLAAQRLRRGGSAFLVDIESVRVDADSDNIGAQLPQRFRHHLIGRAVSAIDHHAQAVEAEIARQRALGEFDVAVMDTVDPAGTPETGALRQTLVERLVQQSLDLLIDIVGQFKALRAEQLDAVVFEQIMRSGNHHAEIGTHRLGQHRHRRRRHRAKQQHIHADRGKSGHHRVFDHVAGKTRILADDDAVAMLAALKHQTSRLPDLERQLRRNQTVGTAPNPIRPEIFAAHVTPSIAQASQATRQEASNARHHTVQAL